MTDKEKIIIDGVDVSECKYHEIGTCFDEYGDEVEYDYCLFTDDSCNNLLKQNECVYLLKRQLQRKEQEYEKLQEQISKIKEYVRHNMFDVERENWFEIFIYTFEDWKKSILENENKYKKECEKYEQTLDEIENYINSQGIDNKWNMYIQRFRSGILNIINKAKDGNNE